MKTEKNRRRGLGWLAAGLLAALPAAQAADDIAADWRELLATGNYEAVEQTYTLVTQLRGETGKVDAALCREKAAAIDAALKVNRVGLGLWLVAQECASASGDEALAGQRQRRFEALLAHALQGRSVLQGQVPIKVLALQDAEAVALATGQKILFRSFEPYEGERHLVLTLVLWDEGSQRETNLEFDYMDAAVQLQRDRPGAEFPSYRRKWVDAAIKTAVQEAPDSSLAQLQLMNELMVSEKEEDLLAALRQISAQAQAGDLMANLLLAFACLGLDCREQAMDSLLPLAEKRYAMALVALALLQSREGTKAANDKAVLALLAQADRRLGGVDGSLMFVALSMQMEGDAKRAVLVEKTLEKAAAAGSLRAGVVLPVLQGRKLAQYNDTDLARLGAAADAGMPMAQYNYSLHLMAQKQMAQGEQMMLRAAEAGFAPAQNWLGIAYFFGKKGPRQDTEAGLLWLKQAGHGGQGDASAMVGMYYSQTGSDLAGYQRAEGWLQSGVEQESTTASVLLAQLYERDIDGLGGNSAAAAKLYQRVVAESDNAMARRGLADLLAKGRGVEQDLPRAEKLLRPDAQNGQAQAQLQLGELLMRDNRSAAEMAEGVKWLRQAADAGVMTAKVKLADALWWGQGTPAEPKAARALWQEIMAQATIPWANNNFAWAHCTPKDPALLDAAAGLAAIQKLTEGDDDVPAFFIGTLAACQAASGDFSSAIANQKRAIAKLEAAKKPNPKFIKNAQDDLERYKSGKRNDLGNY